MEQSLTNTERQAQLDQPTTLIAACGNGVAGVIVFALLPLLVGKSVDGLGISELQAGSVVSAYYLTYALVAFLSIVWIRKVNWKKACLAGAIAMLIGLYTPILMFDYNMLLVGMALAGAGAAIVFPLSLTMVADMTHTDRAYGIKLVPEQLIPAVMLIVLSGQLIENFGLQELLITFSIIPFAVICMYNWVPVKGLDQSQAGSLSSTDKKPLFLGVIALLSLTLFFLGFSGLWAFCERIATDSQLGEELTGQLIAVGLISSGLGPLLAAIIEDRYGRVLPIIIGCLISCLSLLLLLGNVSATHFGLVMAILPFAFYYSLTYFFAIVADSDGNGKIAGLMAFALAIGAAVGSSAFGSLRAITTMEISLTVMATSMIMGSVIILTLNHRLQK